nr:hypothetical protein [Oceanococcus sp. HetDA_MAG_MS8]
MNELNNASVSPVWRLLAALMAAGFLLAGADGEPRVQASFLLLGAASLWVGPELQRLWQRWEAGVMRKPLLWNSRW